jgi:hypothetical protein
MLVIGSRFHVYCLSDNCLHVNNRYPTLPVRRAASSAAIRPAGVENSVFGLSSDFGVRPSDIKAAGFSLAAIRQTPRQRGFGALPASILIVNPARRP